MQQIIKKMQSHELIPDMPYLARMKDTKILKSMENKKEIFIQQSKRPMLNIQLPINLHVSSISTESWSPLHRNHPS